MFIHLLLSLFPLFFPLCRGIVHNTIDLFHIILLPSTTFSSTLLCFSYCSNEEFNLDTAEEVGWDTMTTYWPDVEYQETDPNYDDFWIHEWEKHGTCR